MLRVTSDQKGFEYTEITNLENEIKMLISKTEENADFVLKSEGYFMHFFESKIEETNSFLFTNQLLGAKKHMEWVLKFTYHLVVSLHRRLKSNKGDFGKDMDDTVYRVDDLQLKISKVRQSFRVKRKKKVVIAREIIPKSTFFYSFAIKHSTYFSKIFRFIFIVMANDAYLDFLHENVTLSIGKIQRLLLVQKEFTDDEIGFMMQAILQANMASLLFMANKFKLVVEFAARAMLTLNNFDYCSFDKQKGYTVNYVLNNLHCFLM